MVRMAIYKQIEEIFLNFDIYIEMAKRNSIFFNEMIEVDYCKQKKKVKKSEKDRAVKDLINKLVLTYGVDGAINRLKLLKEFIVPRPPNNNLLVAVMDELIDEIERIYRTAIENKLIKLLELASKNAEDTTIINLINREVDIEFLLGLEKKYESVEQITYYPVKEKNSPANDISLMLNRRINISGFISNYVLLTLGWEEFKKQVFTLIELASVYQDQNQISANFLPNLMEKCNELAELEQNLTEGRSIKRVRQNSLFNRKKQNYNSIT